MLCPVSLHQPHRYSVHQECERCSFQYSFNKFPMFLFIIVNYVAGYNTHFHIASALCAVHMHLLQMCAALTIVYSSFILDFVFVWERSLGNEDLYILSLYFAAAFLFVLSDLESLFDLFYGPLAFSSSFNLSASLLCAAFFFIRCIRLQLGHAVCSFLFNKP